MTNAGARLAGALGLVAVAAIASSNVLAHPGSGIVVDRQGQVYFADTGVNSTLGVWKIDQQEQLSRQRGPHHHFLAIDHQGHFASAKLPSDFEALGKNPTLVFCGESPVTVGSDGALYYPRPGADDHVQIMRREASKSPAVFATLPVATELGPDGKEIKAQWIHGLAGGPDGSMYYTEQSAVRKVAPDGTVSLISGDVKVPDCAGPSGWNMQRLRPGLRGLDVKPDGTIFVAASACGAVLKIAPDGNVDVVLRASGSWSPTGVAVSGDDLYVLEYLHTETPQRVDWLPRVRKLSSNGRLTIVADVTKDLRHSTERNTSQ